MKLSEEYELRQKTCWKFKRKIQHAMKSSCEYPLEGQVYINELYIGGEEEQKRGRSKGKKRLVQVALETRPGKGVVRAYARAIEIASAESLKPLFMYYISKDAEIVTDEWD